MADFNGDGIQDLVTASFDNGNLAIAISNQQFVSTLLGDGKGGFSSAPFVNLGVSQTGLVIGDFNGDGIQDLAALNYGDGTISLLLGGQGSGKTAQTIAFGSPQNAEPDAAPFGVNAVATSGLPVTVTSSTPLVCMAAQTNTTTTVTIIGPGVCALSANQAGDSNYFPAPAVTQSFAVSKTHGGPAINPGGIVPVYSSPQRSSPVPGSPFTEQISRAARLHGKANFQLRSATFRCRLMASRLPLLCQSDANQPAGAGRLRDWLRHRYAHQSHRKLDHHGERWLRPLLPSASSMRGTSQASL